MCVSVCVRALNLALVMVLLSQYARFLESTTRRVCGRKACAKACSSNLGGRELERILCNESLEKQHVQFIQQSSTVLHARSENKSGCLLTARKTSNKFKSCTDSTMPLLISQCAQQ